jgi:hypothetical protein
MSPTLSTCDINLIRAFALVLTLHKKKLPSKGIFASLDVVALYLSVPIDLVIHILKLKLPMNINDRREVTINNTKDVNFSVALATYVLRNNYVQFVSNLILK